MRQSSNDERICDASQRSKRHCDCHKNARITRCQIQMVHLPPYQKKYPKFHWGTQNRHISKQTKTHKHFTEARYKLIISESSAIRTLHYNTDIAKCQSKGRIIGNYRIWSSISKVSSRCWTIKPMFAAFLKTAFIHYPQITDTVIKSYAFLECILRTHHSRPWSWHKNWRCHWPSYEPWQCWLQPWHFRLWSRHIWPRPWHIWPWSCTCWNHWY